MGHREVGFAFKNGHRQTGPVGLVRAARCRRRLRSVDHFVGELLEKQRHFETNRPCGLEIYHHLELGWLLDGQIGGLCPSQDLVNIRRYRR